VTIIFNVWKNFQYKFITK